MHTDSIVLGGGCFWCLEAVFQALSGVQEVVPGYSGGSTDHPTYEQVCTGLTGHVEVVRIAFDPDLIPLATILSVFWSIHDPTSPNRQGADEGTQYASVIYYEHSWQRPIIDRSRDEAQSLLDAPIVTVIGPLTTFYEAEAYHRNYFLSHPEAAYCQAVISPKLRKLREHFSALLPV